MVVDSLVELGVVSLSGLISDEFGGRHKDGAENASNNQVVSDLRVQESAELWLSDGHCFWK